MISTPMNSQEGKVLAMIGQSVIMRILHSHSSPLLSFINYTVRRYRGYSSFWQQRCHYGEKAEVPATLAKEILMDKLQLCDRWDVVSILFPYLQGG